MTEVFKAELNQGFIAAAVTDKKKVSKAVHIMVIIKEWYIDT